MRTRLIAPSLISLIALAACSTEELASDAGADASVARPDAAPALDAGGPDGGFADGGPGDAGAATDGAVEDAGASAVKVSGDVLVRPSRFSDDGTFFAYWNNYSEQANQLATTGEFHLFEVGTGADLRVGAGISPLGIQYSDDWSRILYFGRISTTQFTARASAYDRATLMSRELGAAAFFQGAFARDGSAAVLLENYAVASSTGEVVRWDWPAATRNSLSNSAQLIAAHDLPRWFLYFEPATNALHLARPNVADVVATEVEKGSVVVSEDRSTILYVRSVGAQGGSLERLDASGAVSPVASDVRADLVSVSADGSRFIYGTGDATQPFTELFLVAPNSAPSSIASNVLAHSVVIAPSHRAVAYCVSNDPSSGVGDLYRWTAASGSELVASGVSTTVKARLADDGSALVYFATYVSAQMRGQLARWSNGQRVVLGDDVPFTGVLGSADFSRVAFVQNADAAGRGELVVFTGQLPAVAIASGVAAQISPAGATLGYAASPNLDGIVAYVPGAAPAVGELYGWRTGSTAGRIAQGVPSTSWRLGPDRSTLTFVADFVDEAAGADHGALRVASERAPTPATVHPSVGRYFTVSGDRVAYVVVQGTPEENGLYLAPLP